MTTHYTFNSTDENNFNRINVTIPNVINHEYINVTVTNLTTNCAIRILNEKDFMIFEQQGRKITLQFEDYTQLTPEAFCVLINQKFGEENPPIVASVNNCHLIIFASNAPFKLITCTYNVKLLLGLYAKTELDFPIESEMLDEETFAIRIKSMGYYLSTPILYLISNIGQAAFRNNATDIQSIQSADVVMRINNSFTSSIPIIASNGEFTQTVQSCAISSAWFLLVDADLHPIDLLNPMYISVMITEAEVSFKLTPEEKAEQEQLLINHRKEQIEAKAKEYEKVLKDKKS